MPVADLERLQSLIQSGSPLIWITTDEEEHALRLVRDAAMGAGQALLQWDAVRGVRDGLIAKSQPIPETEHPAAAMLWMAQQDPAVCIALDLVGHLDDERTLRAVRDLVAIHTFSAESGRPGGTLVLIDHRDSIPAVLRSSGVRFDLTPPDEKETSALVLSTLRRINQVRPIEANMSKRELAQVVRNLRGLNRTQIERTITAAVWDDRKFCTEDLPAILARKRQIIASEGLLEFVQAPTDMSEVGGLGRLKQWLKQREHALSDEATQFGLQAPRGILMLGVQGAGKSLCAKAIATAWKRPLLRMDPSVLYDRYIGESERKLRDALRQAEIMAPVVLWIDEIEKAFASAASRSIDGGLSQRMFGTLLNWMQEHREPVFLAATANDVEALPPELLRKGRFDEIFFVDLPGPEARAQIFKVHIKKRGRDPGSIDIPALVAASDGYSGAEIEQAVLAALHEAFSETKDLTTPRILKAVQGSPPLSVTMAEKISALRDWAKGRCVNAE